MIVLAVALVVLIALVGFLVGLGVALYTGQAIGVTTPVEHAGLTAILTGLSSGAIAALVLWPFGLNV